MNQALQQYTAADLTVGGMDDFDAKDMTLPRLQLVQAQSKVPSALKHVGEWYDTAAGVFHEGLMGVFFNAGRQRVMFPEKYAGPDSKALCGSNDGKTPRAEFVGKLVSGQTIPDICKDCFFSMWGQDEMGKSIKPPCREVYAYAFLSVEGAPYMLSVHGAGIAEAKKLNYLMRTIGLRKMFSVASREENGANGTYFVPTFTPIDSTPEDLLSLAISLKGVGAQAVRQDAFEETPLRDTAEQLGGEVVVN